MQWLDVHSVHPLRRHAIFLLVKLAGASGQVPKTRFLTSVKCDANGSPQGSGGFALVYKALRQNRDVALKRLKPSQKTENQYKVCSSGDQLAEQGLIYRQFILGILQRGAVVETTEA